MPILYIIAGPPGIGKTTNAALFVGHEIIVENSDVTAIALKNQGEANYQEIAFEQLRIKAENNCKLNIHFGIELNLGCQIPHYSYARYWHQKYQYDLRVTLFYTDDVGLCVNRALERQQAGGHRVAESVILDMHAQTIPLLRKNIHLISHLQFVNVINEGVELVYSGYYPTNFHEFINPILPDWVTRNFPEIQL